ncbi:cytochrome c biogenesis protein ResB [Anaeromyxobacter paludicola]|uniref:Cytochrome c biogenesis protein ResB n=1 Tax=Anaeromyxobacter paludicola TaxID=2918171 RepID=A0ABM7XAP1_9BACT|nr:cytochrome c biogenesis protein ResB [Anaeromyxobacter paludicola]BDG08920.1 cytochrome c biogenesis protein ResB [Anaeromyxobacter paludicola]
MSDGEPGPVGRRSRLGRLKRALRTPAIILAEVLGLAAAGALLATVPQAGAGGELEAGPLGTPLRLLGADRVLRTPWFAGLVLATAASLLVIVWDQWRQLLRTWRAPPSLYRLRGAHYRRELERPATPGGPPPPVVRREHRLGLAGSPLLHLGLLLVVLAGLLRATLAREALVDLVEGQPLDPAPSAYGLQRGGLLASPFALPERLRIERFHLERYPSGALSALSVDVRLGAEQRPARVAINAPLELGFDRLYVTQTMGPAAFLVLSRPGAAPVRAAMFLREERPGGRRLLSEHGFPGGTTLRVETLPAAAGTGAGARRALWVTALRGGAPAGAAALAPGEALDLPGGEQVRLLEVRRWIRFAGARDPFTALAYLGFVLVVAGAALLFFLVEVEWAVVPEPGDRPEVERVTVLLRARRFAPLQRERFERLVEAAGRGGEG